MDGVLFQNENDVSRRGRKWRPCPGYRIRTVVMNNGERLPMLLGRADGVPLFGPTVYALTQVRGRSRSAAAIECHLRAIMHLLVFSEAESIKLDERIVSGRLLVMCELDALAAATRLPLETLVERSSQFKNGAILPKTESQQTSLENYRANLSAKVLPSVVADSAGTRLRVIRDYVKWLANRQIGKLADDAEIIFRRTTLDAFVTGINARIPSNQGRGDRPLPEGLPQERIERIRKIIEPDNPDNPWKDLSVRIRNKLIVQCLDQIGIRRGELLAIRVCDLKGHSSEVNIVRRPDSLEDPRVRQPLVKTRGRMLPISNLFLLAQSYVLDIRLKIKGATKHPYLFVCARRGRPLSHSGLTKVFRTLSAALGFDVAAHLLRHSWNDSFSAEMDRKKVPEATEKKVRSYLQGWKETSGTAATYTRRHTREQAGKILIQMQEDVFNMGKVKLNESEKC